MLKIDGVTDLNQISLTGVRAIALIALLIVEPRSLEEIRKAFIKMKIMEESHSDDILRIDLNTIKAMGCDISRSSAKTGYKYVLTRHPFSLPVSEDVIKIFKRIYEKIKHNADMKTLIEYDNLFKKIAPYIYDYDKRETFLGISAIRYYDSDLVKTIECAVENHDILELIYKKKDSAFDKNKTVIAHKIVLRSDKLYLYGIDLKTKASIMLNVKNILSIIARKPNDDNISPKGTTVKFYLKDYEPEYLEADEKIIEKTENGYFVEGNYFNEFIAMQRILSFGSKCVVHEPIEFRNKIIEKLKEMRSIYE